jgi:hypothetical protein
MSAPALPSSTFTPEFPFSVLASALPVALIDAMPSRFRPSTLAGSVYDRAAMTVSVP